MIGIGTLCRHAQNPQCDRRPRSFHGRALQCSHVHSAVKLYIPRITLSLSILSLHPLLIVAFNVSLSAIPSYGDGDFSFSKFPQTIMLIMAAVMPFQYSFNPEISFFELCGSAQLIVFIFSESVKAETSSLSSVLFNLFY